MGGIAKRGRALRNRAARSATGLVVGVIVLAFSASPAAAATAFSQALLVRGDDTTLLSESPISSWGFDGGSTGLHGYGGGRFVTADSGHFTKPIGKDSLELTAAVVKGTHFKQLSFEATKTGSSSAYFRVCFTDVMLSSSQLGFGSGDRAEERIGFSYDKAKYDYAPAGALAGGCGGKKPGAERLGDQARRPQGDGRRLLFDRALQGDDPAHLRPGPMPDGQARCRRGVRSGRHGERDDQRRHGRGAEDAARGLQGEVAGGRVGAS